MTATAVPLAPERSVWSGHVVALSLASAVIGVLFAKDIAALAAIWWGSSTYNHCMLIPIIIVWLVWQRWPELQQIRPRGWLPGLFVVGIGALGWLLGDVAGVSIARHLGIVLMFQGAVIAILGPEVSKGLTFPLLYAFFAIPAGEELVPPLQTLTAKICMILLSLFGVPAHIEGVFITIPNGWFEVAEACSGVKFLVAMAAYSVLAANVCFKSWSRRLLFVAAALALPVLANGIRAWATIYIAHLTDPHFAAGMDHVIYGWFFFGIVIVLLMGVSWRFFDRSVGEPWIDDGLKSAATTSSDHLSAAAILAIVLPAIAVLWSMVASAGAAKLPASSALPTIPGWSAVPSDQGIAWRPNFSNADRMLLGRYRDAHGHEVDLAIAVYAKQGEGHELVGFGQGAVAPNGGWAWTDNQPAPPGGRAFRIIGHGGIVRDVVSFYRVGHVTTGSELSVKIETLKAKLTGGPKRAVAVIVTAPEPVPDHSARPVIDAFLAALGPIDRLADGMASH